jgi:hypothetical protein
VRRRPLAGCVHAALSTGPLVHAMRPAPLLEVCHACRSREQVLLARRSVRLRSHAAVRCARYITKAVLMTRPRDEWLADVMSRYKALEQFSNEEARLQFLRILRSLPYGNSIFFSVKRIEDPIGLLPAKLILGINKRGVHFFRPVPKEYLHSAELRDIMQFGSSTQVRFARKWALLAEAAPSAAAATHNHMCAKWQHVLYQQDTMM